MEKLICPDFQEFAERFLRIGHSSDAGRPPDVGLVDPGQAVAAALRAVRPRGRRKLQRGRHVGRYGSGLLSPHGCRNQHQRHGVRRGAICTRRRGSVVLFARTRPQLLDLDWRPCVRVRGIVTGGDRASLNSLVSATAMHRAQLAHQTELAQLSRRLTDSKKQPAVNGTSVAARAAEDELLYSLALAFDAVGCDTLSRGRPRVPRRTIIDLARDWMEAHVDEPVHVTDLSNAAQVSVRTLRNALVECYGIGPHTYLWMRQLHQIRAALLAADANRETVTAISMRCGVWDLERMTARYKRLFGETPSRTLASRAIVM